MATPKAGWLNEWEDAKETFTVPEELREPGCDCGRDPDPCPVHGCRVPGCRELAIEGRGYCGMHVVTQVPLFKSPEKKP